MSSFLNDFWRVLQNFIEGIIWDLDIEVVSPKDKVIYHNKEKVAEYFKGDSYFGSIDVEMPSLLGMDVLKTEEVVTLNTLEVLLGKPFDK